VKLPPGHLIDWYRIHHRRYNEPIADLCKLLVGKHSELYVIDIGANIGDTAALMAQSTSVSVLCIEGNPTYIALLKPNLKQISSSSEIEESYVGPQDVESAACVVTHSGTSSITLQDNVLSKMPTTKLRSLASILADHPRFTNAKLLKLDTDGFDAKIIMASTELLADVHPIIYMEYTPVGLPDNARDCRAMIKRLCDIGYEYFHVFDNHGNHMLRLTAAETHQFRALNAYLRNSCQDTQPAVYYFDICAMTEDNRDISEALLEQYISDSI
jgi:FkbM family methyltransferase